ncbi:hypothetical protein M5689_018057 [Euphorbia peplus]|nr:hypothetical protein M5689_018057 [Euphorbia peplus]
MPTEIIYNSISLIICSKSPIPDITITQLRSSTLCKKIQHYIFSPSLSGDPFPLTTPSLCYFRYHRRRSGSYL